MAFHLLQSVAARWNPAPRRHIGRIGRKRQPLDLPVRSFCDAID
jgi:hypothetical protein